MPSVIHLLPYDGVGGAEVAARSALEAPMDGIDFKLQFLFPKVTSVRQRRRTFDPLAIASALRRLRRERPDLLIVSLWRSCIVGVLLKLLNPGTRLVVLIHNSVDAHLPDWLFTRLAMAMADAVWVDSMASLERRFKKAPTAPVRLISFVTHRLAPLAEAHAPAANFVFWGRLAAQKNLARALRIFQRIHGAEPLARFTVIGPDAGELAALRRQCEINGIADAVAFTGPLEATSIRDIAARHCFYLQTSSYEGMAMAVVEAMQYGLVPVVTPVGEIGRYCRDEVNSVIIANDEQATRRVLQLLSDAAAWRNLRRGALATWRDVTLYRDSVATECRRSLQVDRTGD